MPGQERRGRAQQPPRTMAASIGAALLGAVLLVAGSAGAGTLVPVTLERVLPGATLERPVHLAPVPGGGGALVVVQQGGTIRRFAGPQDGDGTVFLDIRDEVSDRGNEEGLLSIAFHPGFAQNGTFYVYHSAARPRRSVLARYVTTDDRKRADPDSRRVLLEVGQPYSNHNGGQLAFGPEGMLYVALGDGGAGGDPHGNGQNRRTLLGSILRIDVDRPGDGRAYAIPGDNPFAGADDGSRPEIWAYGLRNPWRFSFDRVTGRLYAGDVGQSTIEEVDLIRRGGNYGWNIMEGTRCYSPPEDCERPGLTGPISEYTHREGRSITGGFVYRGQAIAALRGRYVFADYASGTIWSIPAGPGDLRPPETLLETRLNIASFGQDAGGELYVLDHRGGRVYRLAPGS